MNSHSLPTFYIEGSPNPGTVSLHGLWSVEQRGLIPLLCGWTMLLLPHICWFLHGSRCSRAPAHPTEPLPSHPACPQPARVIYFPRNLHCVGAAVMLIYNNNIMTYCKATLLISDSNSLFPEGFQMRGMIDCKHMLLRGICNYVKIRWGVLVFPQKNTVWFKKLFN